MGKAESKRYSSDDSVTKMPSTVRGWTRLKLEARSFIQVSHMSAVAQGLGKPAAASMGTISGIWIRKGTDRT